MYGVPMPAGASHTVAVAKAFPDQLEDPPRLRVTSDVCIAFLAVGRRLCCRCWEEVASEVGEICFAQ